MQIVSEGDLIYSIISAKGAIVSHEHNGYLFTQNFRKIVTDGRLSKKYLLYLLNEDEKIKRQLEFVSQGSRVQKVTIQVLKDIILPKLPILERQELIGSLYLNQLHLETLKREKLEKEHLLMLEKLKGIVNDT